MSLPVTQHPSSTELEQYAHGRLARTEASAIEAHVRTCPACRDVVTRVATDELGSTNLIPSAGGGDTLPPGDGPREYATIVQPYESKQFSAPPVADPMPAGGGQEFGDYELQDRIARGGMGVVFKARQRSLNRLVALKMIRGDMLDTEKAVQRFYQEARAAAALDHPNIVPIYEIGQQNGQHYFTMAFIAGQRLTDKVPPGKPMAPREAVELLLPMADAVAFAHKQGIIHRDLKPDNVLLDPQGRPRITDFGLAKRLEAEAHLTTPGTVLGTPEYMAPEQALGKERAIGPACDIYALGGMLYFLLTGRPPFIGGSATEVLSQLLVETPVPARQINQSIPAELSAICERCLAKDPAQRYQSAGDFKQALQDYLDGTTTPTARITAPPEPAPVSAKGPPVLAIAGALLAVVALVVGAVIWFWPPSEKADNKDPGRKAVVAKDGDTPNRDLDATPKEQLTSYEWQKPVHKDFPLKVQLIGATPDKDGVQRMKVGDRVHFRIETAKDAYVGIWWFDPDGTAQQLFPNHVESDHLVKANRPRIVPAEDSKDTEYAKGIEATPSKSVEHIRVVAMTKHWEPLLGGTKVGPFRVFQDVEMRKQLASQVRGLALKSSTSGAHSIADVEIPFFAEPAR